MRQAWLLGFLGVLGFSLTLPATQLGDPSLGPALMGFGRAALAAVPAALWLLHRRAPFPRRHWRGLTVVALGVVIGFPWLAAVALTRLPSANGAIVVALQPLATALVGARREPARLPAAFWAAGGVASATVLAYALLAGGQIAWPDVALLGAVAAAAFGYAEGGRLAADMAPHAVILWALVLASPVTVLVTASNWPAAASAVPLIAWGAMAYVALGSQLFAFFAWYRGLARGGVARISQVQYAQVFLTLVWSAWLLRQPLTWLDGAAALVVAASVSLGHAASRPRAARVSGEEAPAAAPGAQPGP